MNFYRKQGTYCVVRITGPAHNFLGIDLCAATEAGGVDGMRIIELPSEERRTLNTEEVIQNARNGVADANKEFGTNLVLKQIEFVPSDSPPSVTYRHLAHAVVERLHKGLPFVNESGR